jgi:hypothetical protein
MGYVIRAVDDNAPVPLPMELVLICDGEHAVSRRTQRFGEPDDGANFIELLSAAAKAGWSLRTGPDSVTLCSSCKTRRPSPSQGSLF